MKERIDKVMADSKLVASRAQAKSLIENGHVTVDGRSVKKAGELIDLNSKIEIAVDLYVGRGAFKLEKALAEFKTPVKGLVFLDVGASTGGFTEILLKNGASKIYAIDVGHDQLAQKLKDDARVINLERTNIRELENLPELADGAVMDLSFISITKVLDKVYSLLKSQADLIALVKPQFEAGKERLPKDGVIKDERIQEQILQEVVDFAVANGWIYKESLISPIKGKDGNKEYLVHLIRG